MLSCHQLLMLPNTSRTTPCRRKERSFILFSFLVLKKWVNCLPVVVNNPFHSAVSHRYICYWLTLGRFVLYACPWSDLFWWWGRYNSKKKNKLPTPHPPIMPFPRLIADNDTNLLVNIYVDGVSRSLPAETLPTITPWEFFANFFSCQPTSLFPLRCPTSSPSHSSSIPHLPFKYHLHTTHSAFTCQQRHLTL